MKKITRSRLLGLFFALFATSVATAQTTPTITSWSQQTGGQNVAGNAFNWFNSGSWSNGFADGSGSVGWFNFDINPWISISDYSQTVIGTGSATVPQVITLDAQPMNNSLSVSDGFFYWSQSKGSNSTAFIVNYVPGSNTVSVVYNPAVAANRRVTVAYARQVAASATQLIGITDNVNRVFSKKLGSPLAYNQTFTVSDGVYSWIGPASGTGPGTASKLNGDGDLEVVQASEFDVQYDPVALIITVTYGDVNNSVDTNGGAGVAFVGRAIKASYKTKGPGGVTLGTLGLGDPGQNQGLGESYNLRMNSLTFDNNGAMSNIIKVNGFSGDEIASGMHLTGPLAVAVRTGGDVTNSLRLAGNIDGLGGLVKADSGNLTITGNNTFSGPMIIRDTAGTTFLRAGLTLLNCVTQVGNLVTCNSTSGLEVGMSLSGTNIQPGTVVTAVNADGTSFTISPNGLAAGSNLTLVAKTTSGVLVRNAVTTMNSRLVTIPADPPAQPIQGDTNTYSTSNTYGLAVGMALSGTGMAPNAFVAQITGPKSFIMTTGATATSSATGVTLVADAGSFKLATATLPNCSVTEGSNTVLVVEGDTSALSVGMSLTGTDAASIAALAPNAVVTSIIDSTHFTMSPVAPNTSGNGQTISRVSIKASVTGNSLVTNNLTLPTITLAPVPLPTKILEDCFVRDTTLSISCPTTVGLVVGMSVSGTDLQANTVITSITDSSHFTVNLKPNNTNTNSIITVGTATTNGSTTVTTYSTAGLVKGMSISGANIQSDTVINTITDGIRFTLSKAATASGSGLAVFVGYATTAGSKDVIAYSTAGLVAGQTITATGPGAGPYITAGSKIATIVAATSTTPPIVRLDTNAANTGSGLTLQVGTVVTSGSTTVKVASTTGLVAGMIVRGPGIPADTVVSSVTDAFNFVMSKPATASGSIVTVTASTAPGLGLAGLSTTAGSTTITSSTAGAVIPGLSNLTVGTLITGAGIPDNAVVTSIASDLKSFTISAPTVGATSNLLLTAMTSPGLVLTGCSMTVGSPTITCDLTTGLVVGSLVTGKGMPDNAIVTAVNSSTTFTISSNATQTITPSAPTTLTATAGGYALTNFGQSVAGASTAVNSPVVTVTSTALLRPGMVVTGTNIPSRAVIVSITDATHFVLSTNATATGSVPNMLASDPRVVGVAVNGAATVPGSTTITLTGSTTAGLQVGQLISGTSPFIPANAIITAKPTSTTFTISMPAGGAAPQGGLTLIATDAPGLVMMAGATQANSSTVTVASTANLAPGMLVKGANLPVNAVVTDVTDATHFVISTVATGTASNLTFLASSLATLPIYNAQTTAGSNVVGVDSTAGLSVGLPVSGEGIPAGATITQLSGPTGAPSNRLASFLISANASASATGRTLMAVVPLMNADVVATNAITQNKNRAILCDSTAGMVAGMAVVGPNIPNGATVSLIASSRLFLISQPASADGWGLTLGVGTNAISSSNLVLGTANRDGNSSAVLQFSAPNQINDDAVVTFDGASSRNPYMRMFGFSEALGGIIDYTSNGVIENTESENGVFASSVMTLNTSMNYDYNGFFRNRSGGDSTGTIGVTKLGTGTLAFTGGNISYTGDTTIRGGGIKLTNTTNFGSNINVSRGNTMELSTTSDWQFNQQIFGAGTLLKTGLNTVTLANDNGLTGQTNILQGTLRVASGVLNETVGSTGTGATTYTRTLARPPAPGTLYVEDKDSANNFFHAYHDGATVNGTNPGTAGGTTSSGWTVTYNRVTRLLTVSYPNAQGGAARNIVVSYRPADTQRIGNSNGADKVFTTTLASTPLGGTLYVTDSVNNPIAITNLNNVFSGSLAGGGTVKYDTTTRVLTVTYTNAPAYGLALTAVWNANEGLGATSAIALNSGTFLIENQNSVVTGTGIARPELNSDDRVNNNALILSNGGNLTFRHNSGGTSYSEKLGALNLLSGFLTVTTNQADATASKTSTLEFASLNRVAGSGATVLFTGQNVGLNTSNVQQFTNQPALLNGTMIGGYAVVQEGGNFDFATYGPNGIRTYNASSVPARSIGISTWTSNKDVVVRGGNQTNGTKDITANSLLISDNTPRTVSLNTRLLTIASGGIIFAGNSGTNSLTNAHQITNGTLTSGALSGYELDLWTNSNAQTNTIAATIINDPVAGTGTPNQGLTVVKSGLGEVKLSGSNKYTGGTRINGGNVEISNLPNLGALPNAGILKSDFLVMNGGALQLRTDTAASVDFTSNYGITLGVGGGAFVPDNLGTFNISSPITGPGGLTVGSLVTASGGAGNVVISGNNSFQGALTAQTGTLTIMGGSNTFTKGMVTAALGVIDVHDGSALPFNPTLTMAGGALTLGSSVRISTLTGADGSVINTEDDRNTAGQIQVMNPGAPILLTIDQVANSTFSGQITDRTARDSLISIEKKGAGVLTLNQSTSAISDYRGMTKISEGIIAAAVLNVRRASSSIGSGNGGRNFNEGGADLLYIEDGAGLSYTGVTSAFTNRAFTIGVGAQGAGLYANGVGNGSILDYDQGMLFLADTISEDVLNSTSYVGLDKIAFSRPNEAATLNLGGRNLGDNRFSMELHDNGVGTAAKPLSLQKSGDGNWVMGAGLGQNVTLTNCSIGDQNIGDPENISDRSAVRAAYVVTCASTAGLLPRMLITGHPAIPPGDRVDVVLSPTQFLLLEPATGRVSGSPGVTLTAVADSLNDFTGNTVVYLGNLAVEQNGVLGAATGATSVITNCVTTSGSLVVTCDSTARLVPGMALRGFTIPVGAKVASIENATHFTMNIPAVHAVNLTFVATTAGSNIVRTTTTENLFPGMALSGVGIPVGATVDSIIDNSHFKMNVNASVSAGSTILYNVSTSAQGSTVTVPSTSDIQVGMTVTGPALFPGTTVTAVNGPTSFNINQPASYTFNSEISITASITVRAQVSDPVSVPITATGGGIVQLISGNLDLRNVQYTSAKTVALDGGRLRALVGNSLWAGNMITDIGTTIEVGTGASLALGGSISGRAGITKAGFGTLVLQGGNTFFGGFNVSEGAIQLDYTHNTVGKLADGATLTLGGGRKGATVDIIGTAASVEKVNNTTLNLGLNRITRSDPNSTTKLGTNNFTINQGGTLDVQYNAAQGLNGVVATTDRANEGALSGASTGILGAWATVNFSDWASNAINGIVAPNDGNILPYTGYLNNTWGGPTSNANVTSNNTQTGATTYTLRFGTNASTITTLVGDNTLRGGGILQAPAAGAVSNIITGGRLLLGNNNQGGNLVIQQHDTAGSLQINSAIANANDIYVVSAISYGFNGSPQGNAANRFYLPAGTFNEFYYTGMPVLGPNVRPGSVINGFQTLSSSGSNFNISQNIASKLTFGVGDQKIAVLANLKPDTVTNRIRLIFDANNPKPYPLPAVGQTVVGLGVPPGTTITAVENETDYLLSDNVPTQNSTGLFLSPRPPVIADVSGTTGTIKSPSVLNPALVPNQSITGPGIPDGTKIVAPITVSALDAGTQLYTTTFTTSKPMAPANGVAVTFGSAPPPVTTWPVAVAPNGVPNQIHIATNTPGNSTANLPNPPLVAGQLVTGPGIPENTVISSVIGTTPAGTDFLLNNNLIAPYQYATATLRPGTIAKQIRITDAVLPDPPLKPGYFVTGPGITVGTVIVSISPTGTDLVLSNAVAPATGVKLGFSSPQILTATLRADGIANKIRITDANLPNPPLAVGQLITGPNIPLGTTITQVLAPVLGPRQYAPNGTDFLLSNDVPATIGEIVRVAPLPPPTSSFKADLVVDGDLRQFHIVDDAPPSPALVVGTPVTSANIPDGTVITEVLSDFNYRVSNDMTATSPSTPAVVLTTIDVNFQMWGELNIGGNWVQTTVKNSPAYQVHLSVGNTTGLAEDQLVSGLGIPQGATIASIVNSTDFTFRFQNSHILQVGAKANLIGDIAFGNNSFNIHLTRGDTTGVSTGALVDGNDIQFGTAITAFIAGGTDFTVNRSPFAPVEDIIIQSRNGLLKAGDGVAQLGGANTFTGPITITGGALSVSQVTDGGQAGTLGASSIAASNITIGGGTFQYTGNSASVNRGFTINEVGGIDVANAGTTLNFSGNLSGGVGAALGTLQKFGQGTLQLSRTVTLGGATNFGGFDVREGTLQLKYNNPNDGSPNDRFASTLAALTVSGGKFELVGTPDNIPLTGSNTSEDRSQALRGQFTVSTGASEIRVTGARNTAITLTLQDAATPYDVVRQNGGTVLFVENPNGGTSANIVLALNQISTGKPLTWATYWDTSLVSQPGVNNFAAIEPSDYGVVSADATRLYTIASKLADWSGGSDTVSESGTSFSGILTSDSAVNAIRFFAKADGAVTISNNGGPLGAQARLQLRGGAILAATNSGNYAKVIQGGQITSGLRVEGSSVNDLIIHNYNPARPLEIKSEIVDNNFTSPSRAVNLVITGTGTTMLYGNNDSTRANFNKNSYTGTTFLNGGVLRLANAGALPGGVGVTGGTSNLTIDGGKLGLSVDFTRSLGTGASQVQWTGNGGFAAYGTDVNVNLGGAVTPQTVVWGAGGFVPDSSELSFSSADATNNVRFLNPINLGGVGRTVNVADGLGATDAELVGGLSGNGGSLRKTGQGTLRISGGIGTQTGGAVLAEGKLSTNANSLGSGPLGIGTTDDSSATDALILELRGGTFSSPVTVGDKNSTSITSINAVASPTLNGSLTLGRKIFFGPEGGRKITINGGVLDSRDGNSLLTGNGGFTVVDGGVVLLNGAGNLGSGDADRHALDGQKVDGSIVLRSGSVYIGNSAALGTSVVEMGDRASVRRFIVDRTSAGRSVLLLGGRYDPRSSGRPGTSFGSGGFIFEKQSTLTIDGKVYRESDSLLDGDITLDPNHHKRTLIMVNGEAESPDRNGLYELVYAVGDSITLTNCATVMLPAVTRSGTTLLNDPTVTLTSGSTVGLVVGMSVSGPGIPAGAKIKDIPGTDKFTLTATAINTSLNGAVTFSFIIGSTTITTADTTALDVGAPVFGPNIPAGAVVNSIVDGQTFVISQPVTAAGTGLALTARLGDAIGLNRITEFDEPTEMVYGVQVTVTNGTDAGKTFFLAANVDVSFDTSFTPPIPIYTPTLWKQDALTPNISLLANAPTVNGSPITNNIDINGLSGGGTISLGGSSSLGSGSATFSGNVVLQNGSIKLTGGSTTTTSPFEVTVDSTEQLAVGMLVTGPKMPNGATVVSIKNGNVFVLNLATTGASPVGSLELVASYAPTTRYIRLLSDSLDGRGVVFSGVFSEADLTGDQLGLVKLGTGTVTLQNANTYRGSTTVSSGTLLVNNGVGTGSGTGTGEVTVQNFGSALGGTGTIQGKTTITNGAILSPGSPASSGGLGALSFLGDVYMGPGSLASFQIGGSDADFLSIAGTFSVDPTAKIEVLLTNNFVPADSLSYDLITWGLPSSLNLVDLLDLPSLVDESFYWDTSAFNTSGVLALKQRQATDPPVARFAVRSAHVTETDGPDLAVKIAIQLDTPASQSLDIPLLQTGSTATESSGGIQSDYDILPAAAGSAPHKVHFDVGQTSSDVTILVHNDPRAEATETVNLSFVTQPNKLLKGTPGNFVLTIDDNDSATAAGTKWTLRNPSPTNERMQGMVAGLTSVSPAVTTTVAVGSAGEILYSTDNGSTWKSTVLGLTTDLHSVAVRPAAGVVPAQFVAVGDDGLVITSPDGISWTYHNASGEKRLQSVVWSSTANKFVAVGEGGVLFSSVSGETWLYHDSGVNKDLTSVIFANGTYVAVGMDGVITTSTDGLAWSAGSTGTALSLRAIAFKAGSPGMFMVVGDSGVFLTSPDAVTWTPGVVNGTLPNLRTLNVETGNNRFVAAGLGGVLYTFTGNGPAWSNLVTSGTTEDLLASLSQTTNISLITGAAGVFVTHTAVAINGWSRTAASTGPTSEFSAVGFNGARFATLGQKGVFGYSVSDTFTFGTLPGTALAASHMNAVASRSGGQFVAVGDGGLAVISQDGTTWAATTTTSVSTNLKGITFAKGAYYAVGESGTILLGTVTDTATTHTVAWSSVSSGSTNTLRSIAYSGSLFVAVGANGTVLTSADGVFWEDLNPGGLPDLNGVVWTGSQFVIVGAGGTILTSPDGGVFTKQSVSVTQNLYGVIWTSSGGYAVGAGGTILASTASGTAWTLLNSGTGQDLKSIAWNSNDGRLTAVGASGTILTSDPILTVRPSVYFAVSEMTVDERAGVVNVPVFITQIPTQDLYIRYTVSTTGLANPATLTADYTYVASPLKVLISSITPAELAEGSLTRNIAITLKGDALKELNPEHLKVTLVDAYVIENKVNTTVPNAVIDPFEFILTITDTVAPTVDFNPDTQHQMVALGSPVSMHAEVTGSFPTIAWLKNNIAVAGITTADYNIPLAAVTNAGTYTVKVTNPAGTDTTNKSTKGLAAPLGTAEISVVDTRDQLVLVKSGGTTTLTAVAGGSGLAYQWYLGSTPLFSGTSYTVAGAKLTIKGISPGVNEGDYHCNVSQTGAGHNTGLAMDTGIFHVKAAGLPDVTAPTAPRGKVGAFYSLAIPYTSSSDPLSPTTPLSYSALNLPLGLTINTKTGVISGIPTASTPVDKQVTVTATNPAGFTKIGFALGIDALEPTVVGSFVGLVGRSESANVDSTTKLAYGTLGLGARLDLTTTVSASFSGKLTVGPTPYSFTGKLVTTASDNPAPHDPQGTFTVVRGAGKSNLVVTFTIDPMTNTLSGMVTDAKGSTPLSAWRNQWTLASKVPATVTVLHNFIADKVGGPATDGSEPEGSSFGSLTPAVAGTGAVTVSGKTADGTAFLTTGLLGPNGETLVYQSMYTVNGTLCGVLNLDLFDSATPTTVQKVTGSLTWSHPKQTSGRTFVLGWPSAPLTLGVDGGKYFPATASASTGPQVVMNLVDTSANANPMNANLEFTGGMVTDTTSASPSLMEPNGVQVKPFKATAPATVVVPTGALNPTATSLTINNATGSFTGTFTLTDPDAPGGKPFPRKVTYQGLIVPKTATADVYDGAGYGYFLLPKRPSTVAPITTTLTSPILSGLVVLESNQ